MSVTVILPIKNEELHLAAALESVAGWAQRVVVVDSYSSDRSAEIAAELAARHETIEWVQHAYAGPAEQKNWALDELSIDTDWVLFLDADECVSPELALEIQRVASDPENPVAGYFLNRRIIWCGRWIKHGGWFPNWNLRLFRTGRARYEVRRVHEHMLVDGPTARLDAHLIHEDLRDLSHSITKHDRYSTHEALEYRSALAGEHDRYAKLFTRDPMARRRWIKTRIWARLPLKPLFYFLWAYFLRLGFLDGTIGLRYHALHACFKLFDELKLWELERESRPEPEATHWKRDPKRAA